MPGSGITSHYLNQCWLTVNGSCGIHVRQSFKQLHLMSICKTSWKFIFFNYWRISLKHWLSYEKNETWLWCRGERLWSICGLETRSFLISTRLVTSQHACYWIETRYLPREITAIFVNSPFSKVTGRILPIILWRGFLSPKHMWTFKLIYIDTTHLY